MLDNKDTRKLGVDNKDQVEVKSVPEGETKINKDETERLVKEQAMQESLQHFKIEEEKFSLFINEKKDDLIKVLDMYKSGEEFTSEQVREKLGLTPEWDGTLIMMGESLKKLEPLEEDSEETYIRMVKFMKERMNPDARLENEKDVYDSARLKNKKEVDDSKSSWWHTTVDGKKRMGEIRDGIESQLEKQA